MEVRGEMMRIQKNDYYEDAAFVFYLSIYLLLIELNIIIDLCENITKFTYNR